MCACMQFVQVRTCSNSKVTGSKLQLLYKCIPSKHLFYFDTQQQYARKKVYLKKKRERGKKKRDSIKSHSYTYLMPIPSASSTALLLFLELSLLESLVFFVVSFFGLSLLFLLSLFELLLLALFLPPVALSVFLKKLAKAFGSAFALFLAAFFASGCSVSKQCKLSVCPIHTSQFLKA